MTLPTVPAQWRISGAAPEFVGPITVADFELDAASEFKLNLRPHYVPAPPQPSDTAPDWHTPDIREGQYGLFIGPGGTVEALPANCPVFLLATAYKQDGVWQGIRDVGIIYVSRERTDPDPAPEDDDIIDGGFLG